MTLMTRILRAAAVAVAITATTAAAAPAATATAATSNCAVVWGSLAKTSTPMTTDAITNVRTGQHTCYDRIVVDLGERTGRPGFSVQYVSQVLTQGKGDALPLAGGAKLEIIVLAHAEDINTGRSTYSPADPAHLTSVTGYRTLRQLSWGGSFEGVTTIGVGVRARLPMRVFLLDGPGTGQRLVVDVAHHW